MKTIHPTKGNTAERVGAEMECDVMDEDGVFWWKRRKARIGKGVGGDEFGNFVC